MSERRPCIFMGSPALALPVLKALAELPEFQLCEVWTQPDKAAGRGQTMQAPPVKLWALEQGYPVFQPATLNSDEVKQRFAKYSGALFLVVAYGKILPEYMLKSQSAHILNLHFSLLPRYRGASPIQAALLHGDEKSGVSLMKIEPGPVDSGAVLAQDSCKILPEDDAASLAERLSVLAAEMTKKYLPQYFGGALVAQTQDESQVSLAPIIKKNMAQLDWQRSARELECLVRAYRPWPLARFDFEGKPVQLLASQVNSDAQIDQLMAAVPLGKLRALGQQLFVRCSSGILQLLSLKPEGKQAMSAQDFINGYGAKLK